VKRLRSPWTRAFLLWTVVLLALSILLGIAAVVGFLRSADSCYFQIGSCAEAGDKDFVTLQVAVIALPLIWVAGVVIGAIAYHLRGRHTADADQ
jgi:Na+/proline symporter